jgi:D-glycero-D-manno-heptose 1,7-bisphosphate phosphatase
VSLSPAIFLDRDGVLIEDMHLLTRVQDVKVLEGAAEALAILHKAGFRLVVVSNQTVVARGLATEEDVHTIQTYVEQMLANGGAPPMDAYYYCPHHPNANLPQYRVVCDCRKPRPGLLLRAARERNLDLKGSFLVGDRITDVIAGARAGCRTVLVETGKHSAPPIEMTEPLDQTIRSDYICADLAAAAEWILRMK